METGLGAVLSVSSASMRATSAVASLQLISEQQVRSPGSPEEDERPRAAALAGNGPSGVSIILSDALRRVSHGCHGKPGTPSDPWTSSPGGGDRSGPEDSDDGGEVPPSALRAWGLSEQISLPLQRGTSPTVQQGATSSGTLARAATYST